MSDTKKRSLDDLGCLPTVLVMLAVIALMSMCSSLQTIAEHIQR